MIQVSSNISLKVIEEADSDLLASLMKEVYPPAYAHFWKDNGAWYIETQYSNSAIKKDLKQEKSDYYFIVYQGEIIGNFRVVWDQQLKDLAIAKQVKLHRIYLRPKAQGKAIGKTLLLWLETKAKKEGYKAIWLDAMDEKQQAFEFYKQQGFLYHSHIFLDFELMNDDVRKMSQLYKKLVF
uniref:GNAT family N-acetyltransferase n=1 Tax=Polaribacter sp. TaxID=1920175 RepID=UPI004048BD0C